MCVAVAVSIPPAPPAGYGQQVSECSVVRFPASPVPYHRSLQDIFNMCFDTGFVIDGFYEECYFNKEIPDIIIVRAKKVSGAFHSLQVQRN